MDSMPTDNLHAASQTASRPRLVCFVNGIFGDAIGGGDIFFSNMARAALGAGYPIHFFGGHAFKRFLEKQGLPLHLTLTDTHAGNLGDVTRLGGQIRLLWDMARRLMGTLPRLREVKRDDIAYAVSDYWFDTLPLMLCRARAKILHLGMIAPTLGQVVLKRRDDVPASRLPSLYYWVSQQFSLRLFRWQRHGHVTYSHAEVRELLLRLGYQESRLAYVNAGMDVETADRTPEQPKAFDVVWTGRVHPQKGIDDLLAVLVWLRKRVPDHRALIIGKSKDMLEPVVHKLGLDKHVTFSGLVSEQEKFRLLKRSRVFVMPSHYEAWGIVVGEALVSGVPVVAYELSCYPSIFGNFVRYVKPFDSEALSRAVEDEVRRQREGRNYLATMDLAELKRRLNWSTAQENFCNLLNHLTSHRQNHL
jgi:glycosyltransferase involved in cell wall biosynthesis